MEAEVLTESAQNQISTPFQQATLCGYKVYAGEETNRAALNLYFAVKEASLDREGRPSKRKMRKRYDALAAQEAREQGQEASEQAYKFYARAVESGLPGTVGAYIVCQEMRRAHLRRLFEAAPVRERLRYLFDFTGFEFEINKLLMS